MKVPVPTWEEVIEEHKLGPGQNVLELRILHGIWYELAGIHEEVAAIHKILEQEIPPPAVEVSGKLFLGIAVPQ